MKTPALGIAYSLWLRLRWSVGGLILGLLGAALAVRLFPNAAEMISAIAMGALFLSFAPLLNALTLGPADLGVRSSGFPTHMMVLPASTRTLVGWPMLIGALTMVLLWALLASLVFIPAGVPMPIIWPATLLATLCAWVQAIGWSPFPSPFVRVPAIVIALAPLALLPALAAPVLADSWLSVVALAVSLSWTAAAFAFGVQGLSRARRGNEGHWFRYFIERYTAIQRERGSMGKSAKPPFRSPFAAQLWHECRRNAFGLPIIYSFAMLPMLLLFCLSVLNPDRNRDLMFGSMRITATQLTLAAWFAIPMLLSGTFGPGLAKGDLWGKEPMASFFAIRPMTTTRFVLIKFLAAFVGAAIMWAIMVTLFSFWIVLEASPLNPGESIILAAWGNATPIGIAVVGGILLGFMTLMWRNIVIAMWPTLTGRKWFSNAIGAATVVELGLLGIVGAYVFRHPDLQRRLLDVLPWLVGAGVILKLGAAAGVVAALKRQALVEPAMVRTWVATWCAVCGGLVAILSLVVWPKPMLVAGILVFVPLTRLLAAPLALHWNRHR